jgi:hypothetical protein
MFEAIYAQKACEEGLKEWMRADSHSGYISQFQVYVGKELSSESGLGARVVKDLSRSLVHKNYHIFCDNFFTSIQLFHSLYLEGIYAWGRLGKIEEAFLMI